MFFATAGLSALYFLNKKFGFFTEKDQSGACPIDHKNRNEMVQIAKEQNQKKE